MKFRNLILLTVLPVLILESCNKENSNLSPTKVYETRTLKVADLFAWNTVQSVDATIGVTSGGGTGELSRVSLYSEESDTSAGPLVAGAAGEGYPLVTTLALPTTSRRVRAVVDYPDGSQESILLEPANGRIEHQFIQGGKASAMKSAASGPDCTTGCDQVISGSGQVTINNGKTFCITSSFSGTINFEHWNGGGTLRICGTATPQSINNAGNNCQIIVADGGTLNLSGLSLNGTASLTAWQNSTVTLSNFNMNNQATKLVNYSGNFTIAGSFSPNGIVENYGTISVTGSYNANGQGSLTNSGTLNVSETLNMHNPLTNSGSILVGAALNFNTNVEFSNQCKIIVQQEINLNSGTLTMNGGYMKTSTNLKINGSGELHLQNRSMVSAVNITLNNSISATGSRSTVKSTGTATINGNRTVSGSVEWADNDGILSNGSTNQFINGATFVSFGQAFNCVPVTPCNPEGFGAPSGNDNDGDGVANTFDDYPNDPTRAHDNYFPAEEGHSSFAFEDMWPSFGDFDMNDLVVDVTFNRVTNAQNQVVDLVNVYHVKAVGGTFPTGFAFQLDHVSIGSVQSVTGPVISNGSYIVRDASGLEAGTQKPVVVVWDNVENVIHRAGGTFFNTDENDPAGTAEYITIKVHFATPQSLATVGSPPYNHFLICNGARGREIHLPGSTPTSKADASLFGTGDDNSNPANGRYYKSAGNLPWALFIAGPFEYPVEKTDISKAHLKFGTWAESSGIQYSDWYRNMNGYRASGKIYVK